MQAGYKQTEIGVIPEDWDVVSLGQKCAFRTGPFGSALHKSDYTAGGIPLVNPMHIIDGKIVPSEDMTITTHSAHKLSDFLIRKGDIIIGRRGDMGRCAVVSEVEDGWLCGTGSMIIKPGPEADPNFFRYILSSPAAISKITESSVGSTMINLNQGTLKGLMVLAPHLPEQRAIAAALSDADALIASLDALIAKKRDLKQAAMQQLLTGKTRLPGFKGEWEEKTLGDFGDFKGGNGFPLMYQGNAMGQLPFFKVLDMNNEGNSVFMENSNHWISDDTGKRLGVTAFPKDSIVFAKIGAAIFLERKKMLVRPSCLDNNMMAYIFKRSDIDSVFFYYRFLTIELGSRLINTTRRLLRRGELQLRNWRPTCHIAWQFV